MKVIVNDSVFDMTIQQAHALADSAKKYVPLGIYAVEKDGILELKKETAKSKTRLKRMCGSTKGKGLRCGGMMEELQNEENTNTF